jgi:hypothetical protein
MSIETITDKTHRTVGYIEIMSDGKKKALDKVFHTLGYYDPKQNITQDKNFRTVANGDGLSSLIFKKLNAATQLNGGTKRKAPPFRL